MSKMPPAQSRARSYFDEGELAFEDEIDLDDCPYPMDSSAGANWVAGWEAAAHENDIAAQSEREDRRLDDPRRGQARDLNRGRG